MSLQEAIRLQGEGKLKESEAICLRVLDDDPNDAAALHLLGSAAYRGCRFREAVDLMRRAVRLRPSEPRYRVDLAASLGEVGKPGDAIPHLAAALKLKGSIPELHNNLGVTLEKLDRYSEAAAAYRNAIRLRPSYAEAHHNLGHALREMGRIGASAEAFREALRLRPDYLKAAAGLASVEGEFANPAEMLRGLLRVVELLPQSPAARSALLYTLHYSPENDAEALAREHRRWGEQFCEPLRARAKPHENDRNPARRLRMAYLSPDLREHTVTKFVTAAIQHRDPDQFEVLCYSDAEKTDHVTDRLRAMADHWNDTRKLTDAKLEHLIRHDQIDILVDLRGHAAENRMPVFARKPAPVQVNMVGYFNTTGLRAMDYRVTDAHMDPPGRTEHLNAESLIRIDPSCWCYTPEPGAPEVAEPAALKNRCVTFGSLNKIAKVSEPCARLWARVLDAVPGSRLLISVAGDAAPIVHKQLAEFGLSAERVQILDKVRTSREYLDRFGQIDIALDTWPFNGITTTCDGLWMGVACVSMTGQTSVSRAGKSILSAANLRELCASTPEEFLRIAAELAGDVDRQRNLRMTMRDRLLNSPLMDHRGFAQKLEREYRRIWMAWCDTGPDRAPPSPAGPPV